MSRGESPFGEQDNQDQSSSKAERDADEAFDQELYQRELQGRLMGEKLNPRQFEALYKAKIDDASVIKFIKDSERKEYINNRDIARLSDESREVRRRRMVMSGEVLEEDSHKKIQQLTEKFVEEDWDDIKYSKFMENYREMKTVFQTIQTPERIFEKEYTFDEGLGESLTEHVDRLKTDFPGLEILTRRDRDGYAVVKTQFKPKYKYNLDNIATFDPEDQKKKLKESLEDQLKHLIAGENGQSILKMDKS